MKHTPHSTPIFQHDYRIYLEDTDAGGIVYHANHLKLFERCRRDWLRTLGMTSYFYAQHIANQHEADASILDKAGQANANTPNLHFVINELSVRYFQPILLDSLVTVTVSRVRKKSASLELVQEIFHNQVRLTSANITLVCVEGSVSDKGETQLRPAKLPANFLAML